MKQRSLLAISMGAAGHLVFSTAILLSEAFDRIVGCQMVLWGVLIGFYTWMYAFCIRAFRLRFLFELNQMSVQHARYDIQDKSKYNRYLSKQRNKGFILTIPYAIYAFTICIIFIVTIPSEMMSLARDDCYLQWGIALLISYFALFIGILAPFLLWYLRNCPDAHGIRTEIWINAVIAIPFFVLLVVWYGFEQTSKPLRIYPYKLIGPGNWAVCFTAISHIASVVIPLFEFYFADSNCVTKARKLYNRRRLSVQQSLVESNLDFAYEPVFIPELSVRSLEYALTQPSILDQLQDLAIRDFSSENILFYENYLQLFRKCKHNFTDDHSIQHWLKRLSSSTAPNENLEANEFLKTPIPIKLYPDFSLFYETFIREDASNQVNISHRARHMIDKTFTHLYRHHPELNPTASIIIRTTQDNDDLDCSGNLTELSLSIFEAARNEVLWNIFNSVYPEFVDMYRIQNKSAL
ncbi:hypothetical protein A0J61_08098 [Choanephora cucurbitarum]|uniref:RGS domain-containing protein n=1 Tax=Choanephora cucurbitarum TaxID=101091 RepID=A0A1C7N405_9FUNG|nr:hypothetical protein A0J61_08098 [Choanephora cucurbitarum]